MGELRRLLGAVQAADPSGPQPGLDRLDELAAPLRAGGLDVVVRREGEPAPLPAGVDLSAYRIVQEALTNTLRHARATSAEVIVTYEDDALEIDVRDDGPCRGRWLGRRARARGDARAGGAGRRDAGGRAAAGRRQSRARAPALGGEPVSRAW
jgi:signal transduction histidine kinase